MTSSPSSDVYHREALEAVAAAVDAELIRQPAGAANIKISGVTHNSAWVEPGYAFVAIAGHIRDGHEFISDALSRGATAVVGEGLEEHGIVPRELAVPYLKVEDARVALAEIAAMLADYPDRKLKMAAVTGTKGKTTTAWLTRHLLRFAGHTTGLLSTLGYKLEDDTLHQFPAHFTTPESPQVQETLARIAARGCTHAVVEASSEALAQHRLHATSFDVAIWTNLAPEHLNFHGDMEGYFRAKRILFEQSHFAVLNAADEWGMRLVDRPHITYGVGVPADWQARAIREQGGAITFMVLSPKGEFAASLPMIGSYNVPNALAAMAAAALLGADLPTLCEGLAAFPGVPGRMQVLQTRPVRVVLDFAHTPESLDNALRSLRRTTEGRLFVVLGSAGGPRDPSKRAPLGAVAGELADQAIFTEEDCRDTPIGDILNEMKRGADEAGNDNYVLIPDRREAIRWALDHAGAGDTIVFCGKAGETTLERADEVIPWDEETEVRRAMGD